jgi:hypothetical protein
MEYPRFFAGMFMFLACGVFAVTVGVWALLHPSRFVHMQRYRGLKAEDLNTIGGRIKILMYLILVIGAIALILGGTVLYLHFGGK